MLTTIPPHIPVSKQTKNAAEPICAVNHPIYNEHFPSALVSPCTSCSFKVQSAANSTETDGTLVFQIEMALTHSHCRLGVPRRVVPQWHTAVAASGRPDISPLSFSRPMEPRSWTRWSLWDPSNLRYSMTQVTIWLGQTCSFLLFLFFFLICRVIYWS